MSQNRQDNPNARNGPAPSEPSQSRGVLASIPRPPLTPNLPPGVLPPPAPPPPRYAPPPAQQAPVVHAVASAPPPAAKPDPYVGATIDGRYKIEALIGEGGMGIVYKGRHKVIDKPVALKILRADMARDSEITERFLREARAASTIGNPHIIDISDFGTLPDGSTYFVMEFLDGIPLSSVQKPNEPMPVTRLVHVAHQIADGLAAAHAREIVHRDLKPDNVFLIDRGSEREFVKILDFGIAKVSSSTAKLTRHGSVFGTPHYMSPEQAAGAPVDHRTDIYSLGVILYELASGRVPFDADNFMGILTQHMYQAPVPIRALVPPQDVPPGLEAVILKCLSKKPDQRYQSMNELKEDLEKLTKGLVPEAVNDLMARSGGFNVPADFFKPAMPMPVPATPAQMLKRKPWPLYAGVAGVVAAISIVVGIFAFGRSSTASTPGPTATVTAASTPVPVASVPATAPSTPTAPIGREVLIVAEPLSAVISVDGEKLGLAPRSVLVPNGKTVQVVVSSAGYHDETLTLDGSEARREVKLRGKGTKPPATGAKTPIKPQGNTPGSEIVNPWGN